MKNEFIKLYEELSNINFKEIYTYDNNKNTKATLNEAKQDTLNFKN